MVLRSDNGKFPRIFKGPFLPGLSEWACEDMSFSQTSKLKTSVRFPRLISQLDDCSNMATGLGGSLLLFPYARFSIGTTFLLLLGTRDATAALARSSKAVAMYFVQCRKVGFSFCRQPRPRGV